MSSMESQKKEAEATKESVAVAASPSPSPSPSAADVQIPTESSPYVQYADLEDYKIKAYGTSGHLPVVDRPHHGSGTDAPTLSGSGLHHNQAPEPESTSTT